MYNHKSHERISSINHPFVKEIRELSRRSKSRNNLRRFVAEGERLVAEIPKELIIRLFVSEDYTGSVPESICTHSDNPYYHKQLGTENPIVVSRSIFDAISDTRNSQGILALVKMKEEKTRRGSLFLLLETLQDPGNMGTIFRTAEASGVDGILIGKGCVDIYSPKVVRSTMGSIFRLPFWRNVDLIGAAEEMKKEGFNVYASSLSGKRSCYEMDYTHPTVFLIGNEANGLSQELISSADWEINIPMKGSISSLNAAMATTVLCYEAYRQRLA